MPITDLRLDKNGEIENYYNKEANPGLYEALRQKLLEYNGVAKEAFKEKFYKPQRQAAKQIEVKKVRLKEKATLTVPLNNGQAVADNGEMVRIDIFSHNNKYFMVPIYTKDTLSKVLPNKAILAHKEYREWPTMDENYTFLFSLYSNDLIYFKHKNEFKFTKSDKTFVKMKEGYAYYTSADISGGTVKVITHDAQYETRGGIKTLLSLKKFQVDILGNISEVKQEKRQGYCNL